MFGAVRRVENLVDDDLEKVAKKLPTIAIKGVDTEESKHCEEPALRVPTSQVCF